MSVSSGPPPETLLESLRAGSAELEAPGATPVAQLNRMAEAGVMRWGIPVEYGGVDFSQVDQVRCFELLASACLVSTFVLSQRAAAISRLVASENEPLKLELLPRFARHELMATVGISHLSTSRQHSSRPSVTAVPTDTGYRLNGFVPWVTGAEFCDLVLTGGTLADGSQLLVFVPTQHPDVTLETPPALLALNASRTGGMTLDNVELPVDRVVAGPIQAVMKQGTGGTGSVITSALAVGMAMGVIERLAAEAEKRTDLQPIVAPFAAEARAISADIGQLIVAGPASGLTSESIRGRANSLALRSSQAYLGASKGAGFVVGHFAERAIREAMFFLVWSCPQPVMQSALRQFACLAGG